MKLTPSALLVLITGSLGFSPSELQLILRPLNFHDQINQFLIIISFSVYLSHYNSSCAHYQYFSYTTLLCFSNTLGCFNQGTLILVASTAQNSHDSSFSGFFSFQHWFKCKLCYSQCDGIMNSYFFQCFIISCQHYSFCHSNHSRLGVLSKLLPICVFPMSL